MSLQPAGPEPVAATHQEETEAATALLELIANGAARIERSSSGKLVEFCFGGIRYPLTERGWRGVAHQVGWRKISAALPGLAVPTQAPPEAARARGANAIAWAVAGAASRERKARRKHNAVTWKEDATRKELRAAFAAWQDAADALDGALDEFEAGGGGAP